MTDAPTWIVLVHHLPTRPTRLRVRVWRQLQKLGAVAVKNSVYVLPWSEKTREDFTWLQQEIESSGGEAVLFRSQALASATDAEIIAAFKRDRDASYARLTSELERLCNRIASLGRQALGAPAQLVALATEVDVMQSEFERIDESNFFQAQGRAKAAAAFARCRDQLHAAQGRKVSSTSRVQAKPAPLDAARFQGRLGVTRPRPHIDRCASAWLIRRFIDPRARFGFVAEGGKLRGGIPFDMAGADFSHHGEDCTFETLMRQFGLEHDAAVRGISEIVHDVDLKDAKFGRSEGPGVNAVVRGLADAIRSDQKVLRESEAVFDGLYSTLTRGPVRNRKNAPRRRK